MPRKRRVPTQIVRDFPADFPSRLERLKSASGFSWRGLARRLGTEPRTVRRWRHGTRPEATYLFRLFVFAQEVRGGIEVLLGCNTGVD